MRSARLLPHQNGTHASPPTKRARKTPSVVMAKVRRRCRLRRVAPRRSEVFGRQPLHAECLQQRFATASGSHDCGTDLVTLSLGFSRNDIAIPVGSEFRSPRRPNKIPNDSASVDLRQLTPVLEPELRSLAS